MERLVGGPTGFGRHAALKSNEANAIVSACSTGSKSICNLPIELLIMSSAMLMELSQTLFAGLTNSCVWKEFSRFGSASAQRKNMSVNQYIHDLSP